MEIGQILAFGAGTFFLGISFTFGVIFVLISRAEVQRNAEESSRSWVPVAIVSALFLASMVTFLITISLR